MGDIEDINFVKSSPALNESASETSASADDDGIICGSKRLREHSDAPIKVWMKTFGCQHNFSDSEYMQGLILDAGMELTDDIDAADVFIVNSCTVKNPSQDSFQQTVMKCRTKGLVIACGCVPQGEAVIEKPNANDSTDPAQKKKNPTIKLNLSLPKDVAVLGVEQIHRVVEVIHSGLAGNPLRLLERSRENLPSLMLPRRRSNPFIESIPISVGCLNACTYCKTKAARGTLKSYSIEHIVESVKRAVAENVREIRLVSEDTGCYGLDIKKTLPELLRAVLDVLPEHVMLRLGMTNPPYLKRYVNELCQIFHHPNMYEFVHIPVQSGSDDVLKAMKRGYTQKDFRDLVAALRKDVPGITIATDIICGFPTETKENFEETLSLLRDLKLPVVNISQMYPRPGTPAAAMKKVSSTEVKRRSRECSALFRSYTTFEPLVGTTQIVSALEVASDKKSAAAHTKQYVQVLVPLEQAPLGSELEVKITGMAGKFAVHGEVIRVLEQPPTPHNFINAANCDDGKKAKQ